MKSSAYSSQYTWSHYDHYGRCHYDYSRELELLIERLRDYDARRLDLEKNGGDLEELEVLTKLLRDPVRIGSGTRAGSVSLTSPEQLRTAVSWLGRGDLFLTVRRHTRGLPVYCINRVARDYWSEYGLVVEDIYASPGYPFVDSRFARVMYLGHEVNYLRVSRFRQAVLDRFCLEARDPQQAVDDLLWDIGHHCLARMWHEDQRPAFLVAQHLGLSCFLEAIELLYLCLSADLCALRSHIDADLVEFFDDVYPQPAVRSFLITLPGRSGESINMLPQRAVRLFERLNRGFRKFLETDVIWSGLGGVHGSSGQPARCQEGNKPLSSGMIPIYKLLFANIDRFDAIVASLRSDEKLRMAAGELETTSRAIIDEVNQDAAKPAGKSNKECI